LLFWIFLHLSFGLLVLVVIVLSRVCNFIFKNFDEFVKRNSKDSAKGRTGPVDPVLDIEDSSDDTGSEAASRIE
jgi:hypothetical protein